MSKQTINIGASPNDGTGTPLRTSFDYTNQNFTELYTAVGPSGNNIVVPGNATITGDLTVDTNVLKVNTTTNRVGVNVTSPTTTLDVAGTTNISGGTSNARRLQFDASGAYLNYIESDGGAGTGYMVFAAGNAECYRIATGGVSTWAVGGSTAMTLNSTGLGIGASPTAPFHVFSAATGTGPITNVVGTFRVGAAGRDVSLQFSDTVNQAYVTMLSGALLFGTGGATERMRIDATGNVGIGVTPSAWGGAGVKVIDVGAAGSFAGSAADVGVVGNAYYNGSGWIYKTSFFSGRYAYALGTGQHQWFTAATGTAGNAITFTQAMTLDASGNLLVGKTASSTSVAGAQVQPDGTHSAVKSDANPGFFYNTTTAISGTIALFRSNGVTVGTITQDGTNTAYVTSSDYRLKEAVQPMSGGLARVSALKPSIYKWKSNGLTGEGFLAHELAEVVPAAVVGTKDALNEDGTINPQGIDLSKIVPILVAAIQELTAEVNALKNA